MVDRWKGFRGNKKLIGPQYKRVAVVGQRDASEEGLAAASAIGELIADMGLVLISGDARGIDRTAQTAALRAGGAVCIFLAEGLSRWKANEMYKKYITEDNILIRSDWPEDAEWRTWQAHERNKSIMNCSIAIVAIHPGTKGGTFQGASYALEKMYPVYIPVGKGLWTDGAKLLEKQGAIAINSMAELRERLEGQVSVD